MDQSKNISDDIINSIVAKKIEQDIVNRRSQNKKDYFVFGMSENNGKGG
jgi:hypothetical protein